MIAKQRPKLALALTVFLCAVIAVFAWCRGESPKGNEPSEGPLRSLRESTHPITTVQSGTGFADLEFLRDILSKKRIVAMGEATHGTREFFLMKHRMLEFLVREMGFGALGMEADPAASKVVNEYVKDGTGDPVKALKGLGFWTWETDEVLDMIRWMRTYNIEVRAQKGSLLASTPPSRTGTRIWQATSRRYRTEEERARE